MRKLFAGIAAAALMAVPVAPANALSIYPASPVVSQASDNLVEVRHRQGHRVWKKDGRYGRWSRGSRHNQRWSHRRHNRHNHDNWWWGPAAGFGLGLALGAAPRVYAYPSYRTVPRVGVNAAHIAWCEDRYRSYRAWDNSFKPYHGPRRQCNSPYY